MPHYQTLQRALARHTKAMREYQLMKALAKSDTGLLTAAVEMKKAEVDESLQQIGIAYAAYKASERKGK